MGSSSHLVVTTALAFSVFVFGCFGGLAGFLSSCLGGLAGLVSGCLGGLAGLGFMGKSYSMEQAFRMSSFQYRIPVRMAVSMAAMRVIFPINRYPLMLMTHLLSICRKRASALRLLMPAPVPVSLP